MRRFYLSMLLLSLLMLIVQGVDSKPPPRNEGGLPLAAPPAFTPPAPAPRPDTALERQIADLERQFRAVPEAEATQRAALKNQLGALYAQRPENRPRHGNPLNQGGDNCSDVTVIPYLPYTDAGTTAGRANDWNTVADCAGGGGGSNAPDVIYQFTAELSGQHTIQLCSSSYDTEVEIRTGGSCPGSTQVACNDDYCNLQSGIVNLNLTAGQTYWIIVDGFADNAGQYTLSVNDECLTEGTIQAPTQQPLTGTTCGYVNLRPLRPSPDNTIRVVIPYDGSWSISQCNGPVMWDSYMYLLNGCGSGVLAEDDDYCGFGGNSGIICQQLTAGLYFVVIEGYDVQDCGQYGLQVVPCTPVPQCLPGAQFTQTPIRPWQQWVMYTGDWDYGRTALDNFSGLTAPVSTIRFWGFLRSNDGLSACGQDPNWFRIFTYADNGGVPGTSPVSENIVNVHGDVLYSEYYPTTWWFMEFTASLPNPITQSNGWLQIATDVGTTCDFYWIRGTGGDGQMYLNFNGYTPASGDMAFCLGGFCPPPDSVTVQRLEVPDMVRMQINFQARETATYVLWATDNPNGAFPADYVIVTTDNFGPGLHSLISMEPAGTVQRRYAVTTRCAP